VTAVHAVLPAGIDDVRRPSGGNVYDRNVCRGLSGLGWNVTEHQVSGSWPCPDPTALDRLGDVISGIPDNAVVLADGLVASTAAAVLVPAASRLRMVVLVHLPLEIAGEGAVLSASRGVVTTSGWARTQLLRHYRLEPDAVHVAEPGADRAAPARRTEAGDELLCVAPVSPHKGHDVLVAALAAIGDLSWRCRVVGSLDRDPAFADDVRRSVDDHGLAERVTFRGALSRAELADAYATSDLLVHPSRGETYGMVVTEALAHALPVVATNVGGVPEALGRTAARRPGLLVDVDAPADLATAVRAWLTDAELRAGLRDAAARRSRSLPSWQSTTARIARVIDGLPA
jgi:glycosyltransferase involved in cell wall biosynthesis